MATLIQLSDVTIINLDTSTVLRYEDDLWHVYFNDAAHALTLTADETAVLAHYLRNHTNRVAYQAAHRLRQGFTS